MELQLLGDAVDDMIEIVSQRAEDGGVNVIGVETGYYLLDQTVGGFRKNGLYIVGANTAVGKTAFALGLAKHAASTGKRVLYHSLEMSADLLAVRMLSGVTGIPALDIERGKITKEQLTQVKQAREEFKTLPLLICDDVMNSHMLSMDVLHIQEENPIDLLIVDYITLLTDESGDSEVARLERLVGRVRALATTADIPILGLVQLNRGTYDNEGGLPSLRNIRYSDRISHDASAVMLLHRPFIQEQRRTGEPTREVEDDALILVDKNRQGPRAMLPAKFYPKAMKWEQLPPEITLPERLGG